MTTWIGRGLATGVLVACCQCAFALNIDLDVVQYVHRSWRVRDGFVSGELQAITQTFDGFIWVGTDTGLWRFDGVKATPWQPPRPLALPSTDIRGLFTARDGRLFIGTTRGLASWKDGTLTVYDKLAGRIVRKFLEDRDGTIWLTAAGLTRWTLCALRAADVQCFGEDGGPGADALGLFQDRAGTLWVGTRGLWRWKPGTPTYFPVLNVIEAVQGLSETPDGELLISRAGGIDRFNGRRFELAYPFPPSVQPPEASQLFRDGDGGLWIGTRASGILHVHHDVIDGYAAADGLSSEMVTGLFEDREGNVWVVTRGGLDCFRNPSVSTWSTRQRLSNALVNSVAETSDAIWVGTDAGVNRMRTVGKVEQVTLSVPSSAIQAMFTDRNGRLWLATRAGVGYLERDRYVAVDALPGGITRAIAEDADSLWIANLQEGLFRMSFDTRHVERIPWNAIARQDVIAAMVADPAKKGVWLGFQQGRVIEFRDGQVRSTVSRDRGAALGAVRHLLLERDGTLWVATDEGLSRVKNGRSVTLTSRDGLPCDAIRWMVVDDTSSMWVGTTCGLVRLEREARDAWSAAADAGTASARIAVAATLGAADGFQNFGFVNYTSPAVASRDGKLWFRTVDGVGMLDPRHLPFNRVAPPVQIEQITADRKPFVTGPPYASLQLPALTRDVQIDYTGLSFVTPEKVRFRYRLDGYDRDWQDAGGRRQAFYTNLPPRSYRFRVIAANDSGVWNETGASLDFSIAPAYYQMAWFQVLVAFTVLGLVWTAHRVRVRIVEKHEGEISALNERLMKAQEQERIRIAGELHDGVMQEMLAVTMLLGTAKRRVPDDSTAKATIDKIQDKMLRLGTDIRRLSHDLHPPVLQEAGLPQALQICCEEFAVASGIPVYCEADDRARDLSRGAALALFRIVQEALGNAAKHARATQISVRVTRSDDRVLLTISDDGVGFDAVRLGAPGGLGLVMMRERATQLNGTFEFDSAPGRGTTIKVIIPFR